jgi:hypothetical protein
VLNANASVTIDAGFDLEIHGNLTNNGAASFGTGRLLFKGAGTQNLYGTVSVRTFNIQNATTINAAGQVNVTGVLQLQSGQLATNGKLTLKSDINRTAYVDDFSSGFTGTVTGNLTIERYIPETNVGAALYDYLNRYHYIGALTGGTAGKWTGQFNFQATSGINDGVTVVTPRANCDREYLASSSAFSNLFSYDESVINGSCYLNGWKPRTPAAATPRGMGFAARINGANIINASRTLSETGPYSDEDVILNNLSVTAANTTNTTAFNNKGLHIVSNPFWAPIDWALVASSNPSSNLDATMYLYNPTTGIFEHVNNLSDPALRIISTNAAFMVMPLNNSQSSFGLTIPASARVNSENNELLRQRQGYAYGMKITATSADNKSDYARIVFDNSFTEGYDNGYDARKMFSSVGVPSIYTRDIDNYRNGILALAENTQTTTIPLGVAIEYNGSHTLTFEGIADFPNTSVLFG